MKLQPATCKCGHKAKMGSKRPEYYRCSYCYYTTRADWNKEHIFKLAERIVKLAEEARRFKKKAADFRKNNPRPKK